MTFLFVPTVDGILIPDVPEKLAETQRPKPAMLGTLSQEGILFVRPPPLRSADIHTATMFVGDNRLTIEKFVGVINKTFSEADYPTSVGTARKLARFHYVDSRPHAEVGNETFLLWQLIEVRPDWPVIKALFMSMLCDKVTTYR